MKREREKRWREREEKEREKQREKRREKCECDEKCCSFSREKESAQLESNFSIKVWKKYKKTVNRLSSLVRNEMNKCNELVRR